MTDELFNKAIERLGELYNSTDVSYILLTFPAGVRKGDMRFTTNEPMLYDAKSIADFFTHTAVAIADHLPLTDNGGQTNGRQRTH